MGNQQDIGAAAAEYAHDKVVGAFLKAGWSASKLAKDLYIQAFSDMADYVAVGDDGAVTVNPLNTLKKKSKAIKKIREKRRILSTANGDTILEDTLEFELYDSLAAKKIGIDILGLNAPTKNEHEIKGPVQIAIIDRFGTPK